MGGMPADSSSSASAASERGSASQGQFCGVDKGRGLQEVLHVVLCVVWLVRESDQIQCVCVCVRACVCERERMRERELELFFRSCSKGHC